ncbi:MAG: MFS transporter [Candidatus Syntrophosphaera sp.]
MRFNKLSPQERNTAILLLIAAVFNGVILSLNQTQDIISRKALLAKDWQLMLMTMLWPVANFFSVWWARVFERSSHKQRYFLLAGILGRLTMVYAIWLTTMNEFLVVMGLLFASNSLIMPAQNRIYQRNIHYKHRSNLYGFTLSLGIAVSLVVTFLGGRFLDQNETIFRWLLVFTGICGFAAAAALSLIRIQEPIVEKVRPRLKLKQALLSPIYGTFRLLRDNRAFACFERSFFIYGMGFIMVQPVIPIYLVDKLQLSYTTNFLAKGIVSQIGLLLLSPVIGKLHDRMHPFRFMATAFGLLMLFPTLFVVSSLWQGDSIAPVLIVFLAYFAFGIAMAGVNISWNMGSIFFAGKEDASIYQSVHITLTGVRGLFAPVLGFSLLKIFSLTSVFVVSACFFLTASIVSFRDYRKWKKAGGIFAPEY